MPVRALDHFNLRAPRSMLERLRDFYRDVVGLVDGERPPFNHYGFWMYAGERAVLHLSADDTAFAGDAAPRSTFDHVAFACSGHAETERRLREAGIAYRTAIVPATGQAQIFLRDPAGNGVELNFASADD